MKTKTKFDFDDFAFRNLTAGRYSDTGCPGLQAVVGKKDIRLQWRYRHGGKQHTVPIGLYCRPMPRPGDPRFPEHTKIGDARIKVGQLRGDLDKHDADPAVVLGQKSDRTLMDDFEAWIILQRRVWKNVKETESQMRGLMKNHAAVLLDRPTQKITSRQYVDVLHATLDRKALVASRTSQPPMRATMVQVQKTLHAVVEYAMACDEKHERWLPNSRNPLAASTLKPLLKLPQYFETNSLALGLEAKGGRLSAQDFYFALAMYEGWGKTYVALRFLMLTACRSNELRLATWDQFWLDQTDPVWRIPSDVMKVMKKREDGLFIRPLSNAAARLLRELKPADAKPTDFVFLSRKPGHPISNSALCQCMDEMEIDYAKPHGMRASFTDYVLTYHGDKLVAAQILLDHKPSIGITETYRRTMLPLHTRLLTNLWAQFLEKQLPPEMQTPYTPPPFFRDEAPNKWMELRKWRANTLHDAAD